MSSTKVPATPAHPLLASAGWLTHAATRRVFDVLEAAGITVRAVGGTVRNTLLGEPVSDIDLAVDADPETVVATAQRAGMKVVPTGIAHGTVTIVVDGTPFEVTTLRQDVTTDGRRATVAYTNDWAADAERRDFTINALYCDRHGHLLDPVGGLADIADRRVRFIGDAHARIREDYLRILRFFRFSAQYAEGALDATGLAACIEERAGLHRLSAERIHHELLRLLAAPACIPVVAHMAEAGFIDDLIGTDGDVPTLSALVTNGTQSRRAHHRDDAVLRLAALAVSKPDDVAILKARLRLSNAEATRLASAATTAHTVSPHTSTAHVRELIYRYGRDAVIDGMALAHARYDASSRKEETPDRADSTEAFADLLATATTWTPPSLPISGRDVIARGVLPGPNVSSIIEEFERWWINAGFPDDHQKIEEQLTRLIVVTNR